MTIDELFELPIGADVRWSFPHVEPIDGMIVASEIDEVLIRWIVSDEVVSVERRDDESAEFLEWLTVVDELPSDVPVIVMEMGSGD